jgi:hypothetical protein
MLTNVLEALQIANHLYPDCTKQAVDVRTHNPDATFNCASYWDGGSRSYYALYDLNTHRSISFPAQSAFDRKVPGIEAVKLTKGVVLVERTYFCGKDSGVTIHLRTDDIDAIPMPPTTAPELSEGERKCLFYTRSRKSSYGGDSQYRRHSAGMSEQEWTAAKATLHAKGLMTKAGALTMEGKNVVRELRL